MLDINRKGGFFSLDLEVCNDRTPLGEIRFGAFGERAVLYVAGLSYDAKRTGWMSSVFILEREGQELARVEREGLFSGSYQIRRGTQVFILRRRGLFSEDYVFVDESAEEGVMWRRNVGAASVVYSG